jgi:hypothetical protein
MSEAVEAAETPLEMVLRAVVQRCVEDDRNLRQQILAIHRQARVRNDDGSYESERGFCLTCVTKAWPCPTAEVALSTDRPKPVEHIRRQRRVAASHTAETENTR